MPEKVAVLSKIRLLLFISPKFTTCRHPRAICRKDTAVRIEADGYFLWLEKWIMQCYFVMSSEKKIPHKIPTMWSVFFICKLFNNCKMQKIRRLSKCVQWVHLPPPLTKPKTVAFAAVFFFVKNSRKLRFISAAGKCFIHRRCASYTVGVLPPPCPVREYCFKTQYSRFFFSSIVSRKKNIVF